MGFGCADCVIGGLRVVFFVGWHGVDKGSGAGCVGEQRLRVLLFNAERLFHSLCVKLSLTGGLSSRNTVFFIEICVL